MYSDLQPKCGAVVRTPGLPEQQFEKRLTISLLTRFGDVCYPQERSYQFTRNREGSQVGYEPNQWQADVIAAIAKQARGNNLVIQAGAGSGKTRTASEAAKKINGDVRYMAFNRGIVDEAKTKMPANAKVSTFHGYFFGTTGRYYNPRLNQRYPMPAREQADYLGLTSELELSDKTLKPIQLARMVKATCRKFAMSNDQKISGWHVPYQQGLTTPDMTLLRQEIEPCLSRAWEDIADYKGKLPFFPEYYIKLGVLSGVRVKADRVFVDEGQDTFPVVLGWLNRQYHTSVDMFGDSAQAINAWTGAVDAMSQLRNATVMTMPQSYRFGDAIAEMANIILPYTNSDMEIIGNPDITSVIGPIDGHPSAILCRTNGGVISAALNAVESGAKVAMPERQVKEITEIVKAASQLLAGETADHEEFAAFKSWQEVQEYAKHDNPDLQVTVNLIDTYGVQALQGLVDSLVTPDMAQTLVSTSHKTKGLEFDTVQVGNDWPDPSEKGSDVSPDLAMLIYVTFTRAKYGLDLGGLSWVPELPSPDAGTDDSDS